MSDLNPPQRQTLSLFAQSRANKGTLYRVSTLLWLAGIALLCVPMVTLVDVPIARWFVRNPLDREIAEALDLMRLFSHGWGIFLVLSAILLMFPQNRWHVPQARYFGDGSWERFQRWRKCLCCGHDRMD